MTTALLDLVDLPPQIASEWPDQLIVVQDNTTAGMDPTLLFNRVWCLDRFLKYYYGRSPWVERSYAPPSHAMVLPKGAKVPAGAWPIFLLDVSDQPGAIGYHADTNTFASKVGPSGIHSHRGMGTDANGKESPFSNCYMQTAEQDGVDPLEVMGHEAAEMLVDPYVVNEGELRKVSGPNKDFYLVEVGDPVQGRGFDVFAPYGKVSGFVLPDIIYPGWIGMQQSRHELTLAEELVGAPALLPFVLAGGGYQSVAPESEPTNWTQVYGQDHPAAQKAAQEYGDTTQGQA